MLRIFTLELNPTRNQKTSIRMICGCCRFVYNNMLSTLMAQGQGTDSYFSSYDLIRYLPAITSSHPFLNDAPIKSLQITLSNLSRTLNDIGKYHNGQKPHFKVKGKNDSFRVPTPCRVDYDTNRVFVSKIGWIKFFKGHNKHIPGTILSYSVSHTKSDRYFISVLYETTDRNKLNNNQSIGIDMGLKTFATLSNGLVFENQRYLRTNLEKLKVLQRIASRRYQKDKSRDMQSNNWKKAVRQIARLQEHIVNQRKDFLHKTSAWIAKRYSTVCVETLRVKEMVKEHNRAQSIADASWSTFIRLLEEKCDRVVKVNAFFPSSQICSSCGYENKMIKNLDIRNWRCPKCGAIHDRDVNAAKNIKREGLSLCGHRVETYPLTRAPRALQYC